MRPTSPSIGSWRDSRSDLPLAPKFLWKLKQVPLDLDRPVWVEDTDFAIERHVRRVGVPAPGGAEETGELLGQIISTQLDRRIPLWEFWLIEGLANGRVATVVKFHHALLDGVSGASLATVLLDLEPDTPAAAEIPEPVEDVGHDPSPAELLARSVLPNTRVPLRMARYATQLARRGLAAVDQRQRVEAPLNVGDAPTTRWNAPVGPRRSCAFSSVALDDVKAIREAADVKVNDVVLAMCGGAMRSYLDAHGELPDRSLVASCPVSTREEGDTELDNKISNMLVTLATDVDDPLERLQAIAASSRSAKETTKAMQARAIQSLGETAPPLVLNQAVRVVQATGAISMMPTIVNTVISNVPGPPFPLYFAGARATGIFPGSVILEAVGLNVTVLSYVDRIDIGLAADPELVPDLWDLADLMPEAIAELLTAAGLGAPTTLEDAWGD